MPARPPSRAPRRAATRRCAAYAPRSRDRARSPSTSDRHRLEEKEALEGQRQSSARRANFSQVSPIEVVADPVATRRQAAQADRTAPAVGVERIVEAARLLDHVRLGLIEANVVQLAP